MPLRMLQIGTEPEANFNKLTSNVRNLPAVREMTIVALVVVLPGLCALTTKTSCWLFANTAAGMGLDKTSVCEFADPSKVNH